SIHAVAKKGFPEPANQRNLRAQGPRSARRRRAQKVDQAYLALALERDQRTRREILGQFLRDLPVDGLLGKAFLFEQLVEGFEGFVAVGCPEEQEFFESDGT